MNKKKDYETDIEKNKSIYWKKTRGLGLAGFLAGHLTGEILEITVFREQFEKVSDVFRKYIIENNFEPRGPPHTMEYSWMPFYDTFNDFPYSAAHVVTGVLAEIPFQAPFMIAGLIGGLYLGIKLGKKNLEEITKLESKLK